jgi:GT2 family glycosyltransferase
MRNYPHVCQRLKSGKQPDLGTMKTTVAFPLDAFYHSNGNSVGESIRKTTGYHRISYSPKSVLESFSFFDPLLLLVKIVGSALLSLLLIFLFERF